MQVPKHLLEERMDDEECCTAVFSDWLEHPPPHYPATWEGLYELLDDSSSELGEVVAEHQTGSEKCYYRLRYVVIVVDCTCACGSTKKVKS